MRLALTLLLAFAVVAPLTGCSDTNYDEQKEAAKKQWNAARARVQANLALEQYQAGHFDQCRSTIDEALKLDPDNASLHILAAKVGIEQGALDVADRELETARRLAPDNGEALYLSGVVSQRWQKTEKACEYYRQAAEKQPTELAYLLAQAEMLVALGRGDEALKLLEERVVFFEHSAAVRDAVGMLYMQKGRYPQAVDMFRQATILASSELSFREHLALAQFRAGQHREAAETLERLLKSEGYLKRADLFVALGECRLQTNRAREAREAFETAAQLNPSQAAIWLGLGKAALELGDVKRAELSLRRCLAADPTSAEANLLIGYARLRQDKPEDALSAFRKAAALAPNDTVAMCMVGLALERLGRGREAMDCYVRALKAKPGDDLATRLMAEVRLDQ